MAPYIWNQPTTLRNNIGTTSNVLETQTRYDIKKVVITKEFPRGGIEPYRRLTVYCTQYIINYTKKCKICAYFCMRAVYLLYFFTIDLTQPVKFDII